MDETAASVGRDDVVGYERRCWPSGRTGLVELRASKGCLGDNDMCKRTQAPSNFLQRRPYTVRCSSGTAAKMETPRSKEQIEEWRLESSGVDD
ncbi:hypothetical protein OsI_11016 [Oryza sativa Indica Group]|uniref:Uncharacterized protein n=1 Tax=Oryza sativa subsp. indica TaxID=39946 RepID=A2XF76_ORYSI|nr:hypothetical protein OsI_11016 [Oryza sativa Indica Group]